MGDGQHGAGVGLEVALQPVHRLGVQVVGRLVEQQQVGLLQQQLAQRDPAPLAAGEHVDHGVRRRAAQRVHRLLELGVDVPGVAVVELGLHVAHLRHQRVEVGVRLGHGHAQLVHPGLQPLDVGDGLLDVLQHRLALGQRRLLQQDADARVLGQHGVAVVGLVQAGHQLEQRGLAGAVGADDADLGAREERQGDVVEHDLVAQRLADVVHGVDELRHGTFSTSSLRDRCAVSGRCELATSADRVCQPADPGAAPPGVTHHRRQRASSRPRWCATDWPRPRSRSGPGLTRGTPRPRTRSEQDRRIVLGGSPPPRQAAATHSALRRPVRTARPPPPAPAAPRPSVRPGPGPPVAPRRRSARRSAGPTSGRWRCRGQVVADRLGLQAQPLLGLSVLVPDAGPQPADHDDRDRPCACSPRRASASPRKQVTSIQVVLPSLYSPPLPRTRGVQASRKLVTSRCRGCPPPCRRGPSCGPMPPSPRSF